MFMRFRLIVTDLDGTLVAHRHEISPRNLAALESWVAKGAHVCVATGRHPASALKITSRFDFPYTMIAMNGAVIIEQPSGRVTHRAFLQPGETKTVLNVLDELVPDSRWDVLTLDAWYASSLDDQLKQYVHNLTLELYPLPETRAIEAAKIMTQLPSAKSRELLTAVRELLPQMHVVLSTPTLLEIMAPGVSKGTAVRTVAEGLGISREETIAFGDQLNDIDMLETAGYGVAMANAVDDVKAVADRVTLRHDEDGVAHILEEFWPAS